MLKSAAETIVPLMPLVIGTGDPSGATAIGSWLLTAAAVAVIAHQLMGVAEKWKKFTQEKPKPASTYQTLAMCEALHEQTKEEQQQMSAQFNARMAGLSGKVEGLSKEMNTGFQTVLRSLGRLEGQNNASGN